MLPIIKLSGSEGFQWEFGGKKHTAEHAEYRQ